MMMMMMMTVGNETIVTAESAMHVFVGFNATTGSMSSFYNRAWEDNTYFGPMAITPAGRVLVVASTTANSFKSGQDTATLSTSAKLAKLLLLELTPDLKPVNP